MQKWNRPHFVELGSTYVSHSLLLQMWIWNGIKHQFDLIKIGSKYYVNSTRVEVVDVGLVLAPKSPSVCPTFRTLGPQCQVTILRLRKSSPFFWASLSLLHRQVSLFLLFSSLMFLPIQLCHFWHFPTDFDHLQKQATKLAHFIE